MTYPTGAIPITGIVGTTDAADTYAVTTDELQLGGHRAVVDATARNAITTERRRFGMTVAVQGTNPPVTYMLCNTAMGGTSNTLSDNGNWIAVASGGGGGGYYPSGNTLHGDNSYVGPASGQPGNQNALSHSVVLGALTPTGGANALEGFLQTGYGITGTQIPGFYASTSQALLGIDTSNGFQIVYGTPQALLVFNDGSVAY